MLPAWRRPAQAQPDQRQSPGGEEQPHRHLTLLLVKMLEHTMSPLDERTMTYLLVILAIAVTLWWRTALRLVAAIIVVILIFGVIHLAGMLGVVYP